MRLRNTKPDLGKIRFQSANVKKTQLFHKNSPIFMDRSELLRLANTPASVLLSEQKAKPHLKPAVNRQPGYRREDSPGIVSYCRPLLLLARLCLPFFFIFSFFMKKIYFYFFICYFVFHFSFFVFFLNFIFFLKFFRLS